MRPGGVALLTAGIALLTVSLAAPVSAGSASHLGPIDTQPIRSATSGVAPAQTHEAAGQVPVPDEAVEAHLVFDARDPVQGHEDVTVSLCREDCETHEPFVKALAQPPTFWTAKLPELETLAWRAEASGPDPEGVNLTGTVTFLAPMYPVHEVPVDEDFAGGKAHGSIPVPTDASAVHLTLGWPIDQGSQPSADAGVCWARECAEGSAARAFDDVQPPVELYMETSGQATLSWFVTGEDDLAHPAEVQGQAVFLAHEPRAEPAAGDEQPATPAQPDTQDNRWVAALAVTVVGGALGMAVAPTPSLANLSSRGWRGMSRIRRWLPGVLAGLYSRIADDEVLEHPRRRRIYEHVEAHPGVHFNELTRRLDAGNGLVEHHVRKLEAADLLDSQDLFGRTCYFLPGRFDRRDREAIARLRDQAPRAIVEAVLDAQGPTVTEIAEATDLAKSTVSRYVRQLRDLGALEAGREGRSLSLEATDLGRRVTAELGRR